MAVYGVINIITDELVNTIVANAGDIPPDGCKLIEIPDGYCWDADLKDIKPIPERINAN